MSEQYLIATVYIRSGGRIELRRERDRPSKDASMTGLVEKEIVQACLLYNFIIGETTVSMR